MSAFAAGAVCLSGWGALSLSGVAGSAAPTTSAVADPGCTPIATGTVDIVCQNEGNEGTTAAGYAQHDCTQIANRDDTLDYFVFVLPSDGTPGRTFTTPPDPVVWMDEGGATAVPVTGVIASDAKFFYSSAPQGTTELEAQAGATAGTGTEFQLTHTCPASVSSTSSSSTTSTGTSTGTSTTTTGTESGTTTTDTTTTGTTTTGTTTTESTTTGTTTAESTTTGTTTTESTTTGTTTSTQTSTGTTTSNTTTGGVSGSSTSSSSSTSTGGVLGSSSTASSSSSSGGGVGGISTPNTGAGANSTLSTALLGFGLSFLLAGGLLGRRRKS